MLESFAPDHLRAVAQRSGFLQCPQCGLVWFGKDDVEACPGGPHGKPVRVVLLCRVCDDVVTVQNLTAHLTGKIHLQAQGMQTNKLS